MLDFKYFPSRIVIFATVILLLTISPINAQQEQSNSCSAFIDVVVSELSTSCANTELGEACSGFENTTFIVEDGDDPVVNPDQVIELSELISVQTAPYSRPSNEWGVAYMRGNANLSLSLAKQRSFLYFVIGDTLVKNEVSSDEALILPEEPVQVRTSNTASLYSFPPSFTERESRVIHSVSSGMALLADGVDVDGWVRVALIYNDTPVSRRSTAWLPGSLLQESADLDSLPVINQDSLTPMQSFTMFASDRPPGCINLPLSQVLVQTPGNVEGEIYVNGLRLRVFSTVILRFDNTGVNRTNLRIIPLIGHAFLPDPDELDEFESGILIPAGHFADIPLTYIEDDQNYVIDPEFYEGFAQFKEDYDEAREDGDTLINPSILLRLFFWERIPENILNYVIELLTIRRPSGIGPVVPIIEGGIKPFLIFNELGIPQVP